MKRFFALCVICALFVPFAGCDKQKSGTETKSTTSTPGGSTTQTEKSTTETSGENPPPAAK
jgi:hypothetical protein